MSGKRQSTIKIKWVRSGIGFTYRQKEIVRSLGLRRLNQVVERPDTPQIRGLVAKVPHLVSIVADFTPPAWASVPEYTVRVPDATPSEATAAAPEGVIGGEEVAPVAGKPAQAASEQAPAALVEERAEATSGASEEAGSQETEERVKATKQAESATTAEAESKPAEQKDPAEEKQARQGGVETE